jgi:hypothetical protein
MGRTLPWGPQIEKRLFGQCEPIGDKSRSLRGALPISIISRKYQGKLLMGDSMRRTLLGLAVLVLLSACAKSDNSPSERTDLANPTAVAQHLPGSWILVQRQEFRGSGQQTKDIAPNESVIYRFENGTLSRIGTRHWDGMSPGDSYALLGAEVAGNSYRADQLPEHWFWILAIDANQMRIELSERGRMQTDTKMILVFNRLSPEVEAKLEEQAASARTSLNSAYPEPTARVSEPQAPIPDSTVKAPLEFLSASSLLAQASSVAVSSYLIPGRVLKLSRPVSLNLNEYVRYDKKVQYSLIAAWGEKAKPLSGTVDKVKESAASYCILGSDDLAAKPSSELPEGTLLQVLSAHSIRSITQSGDVFTLSLTLGGVEKVKKLECRIVNTEKTSALTVSRLLSLLPDGLFFQASADEFENVSPKKTAADELKVGSAVKFVQPIQISSNSYTTYFSTDSYFSNGKSYGNRGKMDPTHPVCYVKLATTTSERPNPMSIGKSQLISEVKTIVRFGGYDEGTKLVIQFAPNSEVEALDCSLAKSDGLITWDGFLRTLGNGVSIYPVQ